MCELQENTHRGRGFPRLQKDGYDTGKSCYELFLHSVPHQGLSKLEWHAQNLYRSKILSNHLHHNAVPNFPKHSAVFDYENPKPPVLGYTAARLYKTNSKN